MSLEHFWPSSFEKISKPTTRSTDKRGKLLAKDGDHEKSPTANANASKGLDGLDPAVFKAFMAMMEHIMKVIDDKLSQLLQTIQAHVTALHEAGKRLDEVEE